MAETHSWASDWALRVQSKRGRRNYMIKGAGVKIKIMMVKSTEIADPSSWESMFKKCTLRNKWRVPMFIASGMPKGFLLRLPQCLTCIPEHAHPVLSCLTIDYASALHLPAPTSGRLTVDWLCPAKVLKPLGDSFRIRDLGVGEVYTNKINCSKKRP